MSFTDRFIQVPVIRYSLEENDLLGKDPFDCQRYMGIRKFDPHELYSYEAAIPKGQELTTENEVWTSLYFKNGDSFYTPIPIHKFEEILNNFKAETLWQKTNQ